MAATKKKATAIVKWDEKLAQLAAQATAVEQNVGGGTMISVQGGKLTYKGAEIPGNTMRCIVLDAILHNVFYEDLFDPNNPSSPVCYAFGRDEDEMAPHENSPKPQHETCAGCPQNEWGSAERGRGKACGNKRRLALIAESDLEDIEGAEVAFLHVPVTSVRGWAGYVRQLDTVLHRPPLGVITEVSVVPDAVSQFKVMFKMGEQIDGEQIGMLVAKAEQVQKEIAFPYVQIEAAAVPARRGKVRGRAAAAPAASAPRGRAAASAPRGRAAAVSAGKRSKF